MTARRADTGATRTRVASLGVAVALVLTACGSDTSGEADGTTPSTTTTTTTDSGAPGTSTGAAPAVPAALGFTAPLVGGGQLDMSTLAGRPVVLWFWAPF